MSNTEESEMDVNKIKNLIEALIIEIGEDPNREGLLRTPNRVAKSYEFLTSGYSKNIDTVLNGAIFNEKYDEMVLVKNIDFYSLCEHHMLPFYGKVHVAYVPNGKIVGLSKIPRIVDVFARRLQVQERMTQQIADTIDKYLAPKGVAVVSEAYHMCMMMRGVEKQNSSATSSAMHGLFKEDARTRTEFLDLIRMNKI
ncbi:MAG: GTP cyclohydrolase I FolE [Ignavibacteria bacterium CG_4_8_14_3_um_filter_37_9]|nr:GTP cyclohydrolase I FolE [Ignavibacteria bacterium]NCS81436.1 GTP cyclohydrolase I FolE [Ignavibacteria bacterium]PIW98180.1 MAG: GTP cyclohydrolase I FolE [Ignavibacteria bacterium CG_4_8_14_3_um_filter_37_9]PIX95389.1 MAG: GTP cyclohydrolase I FolE [Ignavibacteria bacterium CG_4_10_14_3_um_filter_37_18]PJC59880.1 MAG: GTP cyclohydrolase I FolE [Ignavibacteria bacterium CG_4_9_14_0_2_um_filter_37_13]